jgi:hypothetical protein
VWYYVIFGIIAFDRNPARRIGLAAGAALIAGPRILLLSGLWIVGVAFYRLTKHVSPRGVVGLILLLGSRRQSAEHIPDGNPTEAIAATIAGLWIDADGYTKPFGVPVFIGADGYVVADLYLAASFGLVLLFVDSVAPGARANCGIAEVAKRISAHTFSLYPLPCAIVSILAAVTGHVPSSRANLLLIILFTLAAVFVLSTFTEDKRPAFAGG